MDNYHHLQLTVFSNPDLFFTTTENNQSIYNINIMSKPALKGPFNLLISIFNPYQSVQT